MIKGIIMDLDGTLLDSMGIWDTVGERFLASVGKTARPGFREIVYPMTLEESSAYMKKEYDLPFSLQEIQEHVLAVIRDFYFDEVGLKPIAVKLLKVIRELNIPMVAATSSDRTQIEHAFARLGITEDFKRIFTCSEIGEGKHSPRIYLEAAKYLDMLNAAEAGFGDYLVFEDALYCLETAKKAGFKAAAVFDESSSADWETLKARADFYLAGSESEEEIRENIRGKFKQ